jgi:hypothetical protein
LVGQVARLRRAIVRVFARGVQRRRPADVGTVVADEPASGPPAHWVERVRRGAPGLLEPSLRRRGEPAGELGRREHELKPDSSEEPERDYLPPQRPIDPQRPRARNGTSLLRKLLRRKRARFAVPAAPADASPAPTSDDMPRERRAPTRRVRESADSPAGERPQRGREVEPMPTRPSPPVADQPGRSPSRSEVVEFELPTQQRTVRVERTVRPDPSTTAGALRRPAAEPLHAELEDGVDTKRMWERVVTHPAPRRESDAERTGAQPFQRSVARLESSLEAGPRFRSIRDDPRSAVEVHPWPELPAPLDEAERDVDVAVRAWERQQRLDSEQTRL